MAQRINENRPSGLYPGQNPPRSPRPVDSPMYRAQTPQPNNRDITLMDIQRLGAGIDNLVEDIRNLFRGQVDAPGTRSDVINEFGVKGIDDNFPRDLIQLYFDDITNDKRLQFRAAITNITETHTPEWNQHTYIGRPYPIHQYKGVSRTLTFDFKVYAMNKDELKNIWEKINYLTGLTHPASYVSSDQSAGYMTPPYIELTFGRLFSRVPGYINSLNYTVAEGTSWDLVEELPIGIDVNVGFTIIEKQALAAGSKFYGDAPLTALGGSYLDRIGSAWTDLKDAWKDFGG